MPADKNLYLRSLADKGDTAYNLRLRSDADKTPTTGWLGSMWFGSQEVANPASIMGVLAANIQSVKGVVSA